MSPQAAQQTSQKLPEPAQSPNKQSAPAHNQSQLEAQLFQAVSKGWRYRLLAILDNKRVDPDARDENGRTPLIIAVENDMYPIGHILIAAGASLTAKDKTGNSAKSIATKNGLKKFLTLFDRIEKIRAAEKPKSAAHHP